MYNKPTVPLQLICRMCAGGSDMRSSLDLVKYQYNSFGYWTFLVDLLCHRWKRTAYLDICHGHSFWIKCMPFRLFGFFFFPYVFLNYLKQLHIPVLERKNMMYSKQMAIWFFYHNICYQMSTLTLISADCW